jgi:hypothetical protein
VALMLKETSFAEARSFNKIFAHAWLDENHVVTGSKCNSLRVWDIANATNPQLKTIALPGARTPMNVSVV